MTTGLLSIICFLILCGSVVISASRHCLVFRTRDGSAPAFFDTRTVGPHCVNLIAASQRTLRSVFFAISSKSAEVTRPVSCAGRPRRTAPSPQLVAVCRNAARSPPRLLATRIE